MKALEEEAAVEGLKTLWKSAKMEVESVIRRFPSTSDSSYSEMELALRLPLCDFSNALGFISLTL